MDDALSALEQIRAMCPSSAPVHNLLQQQLIQRKESLNKTSNEARYSPATDDNSSEIKKEPRTSISSRSRRGSLSFLPAFFHHSSESNQQQQVSSQNANTGSSTPIPVNTQPIPSISQQQQYAPKKKSPLSGSQYQREASNASDVATTMAGGKDGASVGDQSPISNAIGRSSNTDLRILAASGAAGLQNSSGLPPVRRERGSSLIGVLSLRPRTATSQPMSTTSPLSEKEDLAAPICDIAICAKGETPPPDFYRFKGFDGNVSAMANDDTSPTVGKGLTLWYRRAKANIADPPSPILTRSGSSASLGASSVPMLDSSGNISKDPMKLSRSSSASYSGLLTNGTKSLSITSIAVIFPAKGEFPPPGYVLVDKTVNGQVADLNYGSSSQISKAFLCILKGEGPPITNIGLISVSNCPQGIPSGYCAVDRTPLGYNAVVNARNRGYASVFCIKRDLYDVEVLSGAQRLGELSGNDKESSKDLMITPDSKNKKDNSLTSQIVDATQRKKPKFAPFVSVRGVDGERSSIGAIIKEPRDNNRSASMESPQLSAVNTEHSEANSNINKTESLTILYDDNEENEEEMDDEKIAAAAVAAIERNNGQYREQSEDYSNHGDNDEEKEANIKSPIKMQMFERVAASVEIGGNAYKATNDSERLNRSANKNINNNTIVKHLDMKLTRLQLLRKKVLGDVDGFDKDALGASGGSFDPAIAALLTDSSLLKVLFPLILTCYSGHIPSIMEALKALSKMIKAGLLKPTTGLSQMSLFDFVMKASSDVIELGMDILIVHCVNLVIDGAQASVRGLHPLTLHFMVRTLSFARRFFDRVTDEFYNQETEKHQEHLKLYLHKKSSAYSSANSETETNSVISSADSLVSGTGEPECHGFSYFTSYQSTNNNVKSLANHVQSDKGPGENEKFAWELDRQVISKSSFMFFEILISRFSSLLSDMKIEREKVFEDGVWNKEGENQNHDEYEQVSPSIISTLDGASISLARYSAPNIELSLEAHLIARRLLGLNTAKPPQSSGHRRSLEELQAIENEKETAISTIKTNIIQMLITMAKAIASAGDSSWEELEKELETSDKTPMPSIERQTKIPYLVLCGRDIMSLSILDEFLSKLASCNFADDRLLSYVIRRLICPAMISSSVTRNVRLLSRILKIMSDLWKYYRTNLKIELAVFFKTVLLAIAKHENAKTSFRTIALSSLMTWIETSSLVEIFLNFENDTPVRNWRIFQETIEVLCAIGETVPISIDQSQLSAIQDEHEDRAELQLAALDGLVTILRHLMNLSGTVHMMIREPPKEPRSSMVIKRRLFTGWEDEDTTTTEDASMSLGNDDGTPFSSTSHVSNAPGSARHSMVRKRQEDEKNKRILLDKAITLVKETGNVHKAVNYLVSSGYVSDSPESIATMLRLNAQAFGDQPLGDYLGEEGKYDKEGEFMNKIRLAYIRTMRFTGKSFDEALRELLTKGGFRLPGEAQKIDRILDAFAKCFYQDNKDSYRDSDSLLVLAYAIVMLNTDLHKDAIKKKGKMTKEQFIRNLRQDKEEDNFPREMLEAIYDSIQGKEIKMPLPDSAANSSASKAQRPPMPQHSKRTSHSRNSSVPLVSEDDLLHGQFWADLGDSTRQGISVLLNQSTILRVFHSKVSIESVKIMMEVAGAHYFGVVTSILEKSNVHSLDAVSFALDMLEYSLAVTLFLDLSSERMAFASILSKMMLLKDQGGGFWQGVGAISSSNYMNENPMSPTQNRKSISRRTASLTQASEFQEAMQNEKNNGANVKMYQKIVNATVSSTSQDDIASLVTEIHNIISEMNDKVSKKQSLETLNSIQKRFDGSTNILDGKREFIREGTLVKKTHGGDRTYTFLLFSDCLVYANTRFGKLHLHQKLPLNTMKLIDIEDRLFSLTKHAFEIRSTVKNIIVMAKSKAEKSEWMRDIDDAISKALENTENLDTLYANIQKGSSSSIESMLSPSFASSQGSEMEKGFDERSKTTQDERGSELSLQSKVSLSPTNSKLDEPMAASKSDAEPVKTNESENKEDASFSVFAEPSTLNKGKAEEKKLVDNESNVFVESKDDKIASIDFNPFSIAAASSSTTVAATTQIDNNLANSGNGNAILFESDPFAMFSATSTDPVNQGKPELKEDSTINENIIVPTDLNKDKENIAFNNDPFSLTSTTEKLLFSENPNQIELDATSEKKSDVHAFVPDNNPFAAMMTTSSTGSNDSPTKPNNAHYIPPQVIPSHILELEGKKLHKSFSHASKLLKKSLLGNGEQNLNDEQVLRLYGLYKQATQGDIEHDLPSNDPIAQLKFQAWESMKGIDQEAAKKYLVYEIESMNKD